MALKCAVKYCKPGQLCGICEIERHRRRCPDCGHDDAEGCGCPPWKKETMTIPELYPENLDTLKHMMARIPTLANLDGVQEVEIRVRMVDVDMWAIIGYSGETGDPCLLRFEKYEV